VDRFLELTQLYARCAAALDAGDWDAWIDCFTDDCEYKLQPRENFDRRLPLATMAFESKGMLRDRAYGISHTLYHDPYYQRHVIGVPRILLTTDTHIEAEANYAVFRTKPNEPTTVFNVGRSIDRIDLASMRFRSRVVVFDSELIPNSIIYPI
jgi:salicylate 5-hydroxylase small subunit